MGLIIGVIVVIIGLFLILRSRRAQAPNAKQPVVRRPVNVKETAKFHAVSIVCPETACDAAKALADTRILSSEVPLLPLPECDANDCDCRFIHHSDRRRREDRRDQYRPALSGETGKFMAERRRRRDRRDDDPDDYFS